MLRHVLVPLDGSAVAEQALAAAIAVCRKAGAELQLLHVRGDIEGEAYALAEDAPRAYLDDLVTRVGAELGHPVRATIVPKQMPAVLKPTPAPDTVAAIIATHAQRNAVDLIVLTTHGRSGLSRLWFGSVAEALLRRSGAPLLLVRPGEGGESDRWNAETPLRNVLVATDGSEVSHHAVELAAAFKELFPADYTLLRVVPLPYEVLGALSTVTVAYSGQDVNESVQRAQEWLDREAATLARGGGAVHTKVIIDPSPGRAILQYERDNDVDLIVLASRSRGGLDRFLLGSVADKVIRGGNVPVLVQQAAREGLPEENATIADEAAAVPP
jgi:nucleotide-binding universal stress UspA family protein